MLLTGISKLDSYAVKTSLKKASIRARNHYLTNLNFHILQRIDAHMDVELTLKNPASVISNKPRQV